MMKETVRIALAQFPVTEHFEENLARGSVLAEKAARKGASLVAFTELSFRPFFPQYRWQAAYFDWGEDLNGPTVEYFVSVARSNDIDCAINFYERAGRGEFYDTSVICRADGSVLGPVRMCHAAEEPGYNEKFYYWPGNTPPQVFDLDYAKVGIAICYDRHFPEFMRALVLQGADLILSPFAGLTTDPLSLYEIEMQGFAFQNQVYVACINRVGTEGEAQFAGGSFLVGPDGQVVSRAARNEEDLLICELNLRLIDEMRVRRPFLRDRRPEFYKKWFL